MELRNVRRVYMAGMGLRIWRKKNAGKVINVSMLRVLYCLYFNDGAKAAGTIRDIMTRAGNSSSSVSTVYNTLERLVVTGYVAKGSGKFGITAEGKKALFQIEFCIRNARPDR